MKIRNTVAAIIVAAAITSGVVAYTSLEWERGIERPKLSGIYYTEPLNDVLKEKAPLG